MSERSAQFQVALAKILLLGLYGAVGALVGAILGQAALAAFVPLPQRETKPRIVPVDIMFVLDCTNSMGEEIAGIRRNVVNFVYKLREANFDPRVGLVSFRDVESGEYPEVLDFKSPSVTASTPAVAASTQAFTTDLDAFSFQISRLEPRGGGDEPESSPQAVKLAATQDFRPAAIKVVILITDAPPKATPADIAQTREALAAQKIDQLHLVVQDADRERFAELRQGIRGLDFSLAETAAGRKEFGDLLKSVADGVAKEVKIASPIDTKSEVELGQFVWVAIGTSLWSGLVCAGIFLALATCQSRYLGRQLPDLRSALLGGGGSLLAGIFAGVAGSGVALAVGSFATALPNWLRESAPTDVISRALAWCLLGAIVALGISFFIPNLKRVRAILGGALAGLGGIAAFLLVARFTGDAAGLFIGAIVLGAVIGQLIALVEIAFRSAWLELNYGREVRRVSLGPEPVVIGGNAAAVMIYVKDAPAVAYRYWIKEQTIYCETVPQTTTEAVTHGDRRVAGKVEIITCTSKHKSAAGKASNPTPASAPAAGYVLRLANGSRQSLNVGLRLTAKELPGLVPQGFDSFVAEISKNPQNPTVLGLRNLTRSAWKITLASGASKAVDPGRSVQLAKGTKIHFGPLEGEIV